MSGWLVIVNSASAGGRTKKRWPRIEAALKKAGLDFDVAFTEHRGHATELTREALADGRRKIASCGGDGTINEVVAGLLDAEGRPLHDDAVLGILPSGTGGDLRKALKIGPEPDVAAGVLAAGNTRRIDAGLIEFEDGSDPRTFINVTSCGLGHEVDRRMDKLFFKPGPLAYALVSAFSILSWRPAPASVIVDGAEVRGVFTLVSVANGHSFGGGMQIAPQADVADGLFDVVLSSTKRLTALLDSRHLYSGRHLERPSSLLMRGRKVEIRPGNKRKLGFDVDGEALGEAPATLSVLPGAVTVCAPEAPPPPRRGRRTCDTGRMERSEMLTSLSHDHHQALRVCQMMKRATPENADETRQGFERFWGPHSKHMQIEEDILFPKYLEFTDGTDPMVERALSDHRANGELAHKVLEADEAPVELMQQFAAQFYDHVRFEERELFPAIEAAVPEDQQADLLHALEHAETSHHWQPSDPGRWTRPAAD